MSLDNTPLFFHTSWQNRFRKFWGGLKAMCRSGKRLSQKVTEAS